MKNNGKIALAVLAGGTGAIGALAYWAKSQGLNVEIPEREIEGPRSAPVPPASTGKKLVDAILGKLESAAKAASIPLGLIVGWILEESAGKITSTTKLDERGYFQLMPSESKALGLDHKKLSMDSDYSIDAGIKLVEKYAKSAEKLDIAKKGSAYFWKLVKLCHTMGTGATQKIVAEAKKAGAVGSWEALEAYAVTNDKELLHTTKHSPKKWFPLVDKVFEAGKPYGFGADVVAGEFDAYTDEDHETLARMLASELPTASEGEQICAAWATKNAARLRGCSVGELLCPDGEPGPQDNLRPFASTRKEANDDHRRIASEVLFGVNDPTEGACDFWQPDRQDVMKALGDLHRGAKAKGDEKIAAKYARYAGFTSSSTEKREKLAREGLRPVSIIGSIELLGKA